MKVKIKKVEDGIINVFKPKEYTSHDVVAIIKKITGKKVGHTGTLDPLAQGVLPILIGKGTQCAKYLNNHDKIYEVELILGKKTTTLDEEGEIIEQREVPEELFQTEKVEETLQRFVGKIKQRPPIYSAIKVNGRKLYEYARKGQEVEIPIREITIYNIDLKNVDKETQTIRFEVSCSKGTYIRTLCEDIAKELGTIGYMKNLIRIQVGDFNIKDSISIEKLKENEDEITGKIKTIEEIFKDKPTIILEEKKLRHFLNGVKITNKNPDGIYRVYQNSRFIGIGIIKENLLKRDIIL